MIMKKLSIEIRWTRALTFENPGIIIKIWALFFLICTFYFHNRKKYVPIIRISKCLSTVIDFCWKGIFLPEFCILLKLAVTISSFKKSYKIVWAFNFHRYKIQKGEGRTAGDPRGAGLRFFLLLPNSKKWTKRAKVNHSLNHFFWLLMSQWDDW